MNLEVGEKGVWNPFSTRRQWMAYNGVPNGNAKTLTSANDSTP
jgi:hypothetical protein